MIPAEKDTTEKDTVANDAKVQEKASDENTRIAEAAVTAEMPEKPQEKIAEEMPVRVDTKQLQEKLAKSFQEVLSGFNRTKVVNAFEALGRATGSEMSQEPVEEENIEGYQVADLEPEKVNEAKVSAERGEAIAHRTEITETPEPEQIKEEKPEDKEITSLQDMDLEALFAETSGMFAEAAESRQEELEKMGPVSEEKEEITTEVQEKEEPTVTIEESIVTEEEPKEMPELDADAEAAMAAFEASLLMSLEEPQETNEAAESEVVDEPEVVIEPEAVDEPEAVTEPEVVDEPEAVIEPEAVDEPEVVIEPEAVDEPEVEIEPEVVDEPEVEIEPETVDEPEEDDDIKIVVPVIRYEEPNLEEQLLAALRGGDDTVEQDAVEDENIIPDLDLALVMELQKEKDAPEQVEEVVVEKSESVENEPEEVLSEIDQMLADAEKEIELPDELPEAETPEEIKRRILDNTRPEKLSDEQKRLFSYFAKVPGMDEQILDAIDGVYQHASEKTSRRGNVAIMGSHGTGKTRLSEGLVKAICKELGLEAVKYANLDASDMNKKDPAMVISKMAGGFLLIERASFMTAETIEKLSQAMDFRTDGMILIIEDDKANMRKLLADYPEFANKFETVISIPVFTNDELVTFARTYAKENGYRMDEMGVLALYELIGNNQREDEPITIGKVKEMVDGAIRRAGGARLGRRISKRHTDENGRILLYEKDFDV